MPPKNILDARKPYTPFSHKIDGRFKNAFIVEGPDDAYFVSKLLKNLNASETDNKVIIAGGRNELKATAKSLCLTPGMAEEKLRAVFILIDADRNFEEAKTLAQSGLEEFGFHAVEANSIVTLENGFSSGFFILPDNANHGDLEKLCLEMAEPVELRSITTFYSDFHNKFISGNLDREHKRISTILLSCSPCETRGVGHAYYNEKVFTHAPNAVSPITNFISAALSANTPA